MNIYIGNLSYRIDEQELRRIFEKYGEVTSVSIINDKFTGKSKGFGFIEMPNSEEANAAIQGLNETELGNRQIKVNEARARENTPRQQGGFKKNFNRH